MVLSKERYTETYTASEVRSYGLKLVRRNIKSKKIAKERFTSHYGTKPVVVAILWEMLCEHSDYNLSMKHLLVALNFLKEYSTQRCMAARFQMDEKTFRKWTFLILNEILKLKPRVVSIKSIYTRLHNQ